jgi:hypothetical protein
LKKTEKKEATMKMIESTTPVTPHLPVMPSTDAQAPIATAPTPNIAIATQMSSGLLPLDRPLPGRYEYLNGPMPPPIEKPM